MKLVFINYFATTYGCNAYGSSAYSNQTTCATGTSSSPSLVDTGMNVILPLTLGIILIVSALVLLFARKRKKN